MPDFLLPVFDGSLKKRLKDMGDGTHAEVISALGGAGGGGGDVNVIGQRWNVSQSRSSSLSGTTARAAGQVIGGMFTFTGGGLAAGATVTLTSLSFVSSNANAAANSSLRAQTCAYIFPTSTPSGLASMPDGATFAPSAGLLGAIGTISLGAITAAMPNSGPNGYGFYLNNLNQPVLLGTGGNFAVLFILNGAYTPVSGEQVYVTAQILY